MQISVLLTVTTIYLAEPWKIMLLSGGSLTIKTIQQEQFGTFVCNVMLNVEKKMATVKYRLLNLNGKNTNNFE